MAFKALLLLGALLTAINTVRGQQQEGEREEDYEVELDPGEEVVLGRFGGGGTQRITMKLGEIQDLFGITAEMKQAQKLNRREKTRARDCRKRGRLYLRTEQKCYKPNEPGLCRQGRWFVAQRGRLDGVCLVPPCQDPTTPIFYKGTCSSVYGSCSDPNARLYLNKRGVGFCECDEGFSFNTEDGKCYRERTRGPCNRQQTWLSLDKKKVAKDQRAGHKRFGKCRRTKCGEGQVKWKGGVCADNGAEESCVQSADNAVEVADGRITCREGGGREGRAENLGQLFFKQ